MARKCPCIHLHPSSKHVERLHWQDTDVLRGVIQSDIIFGVSLDIILMLAYGEYVLLLAGKLSARALVHR
jgi:hypothetical protein